MTKRSGEKLGWIGGWLGGFLWVLILALVFLAQGKTVEGLLGLVLAGSAMLLVLVLGPWKHQDTHYWKLMLPLYGLILVSVLWALWCFKNTHDAGLNGWQAFLILPLLMPLFTQGRQRWNDNSEN